MESKQESKVKVLFFFLASWLVRDVWVGMGISIQRVVERAISLELNGRTLTAT